jgi:hypothetical protein
VCALHWAFIARRCRGIPNRSLSFNPPNQPGAVDGAAYAVHEWGADQVLASPGELLNWLRLA